MQSVGTALRRRSRIRAVFERVAEASGIIGSVTCDPGPTDAPTWARWLARFFKTTGYFFWALGIAFGLFAVVRGAWWIALFALVVIAGRVGMWRLRERNRIEVERWQQRAEGQRPSS